VDELPARAGESLADLLGGEGGAVEVDGRRAVGDDQPGRDGAQMLGDRLDTGDGSILRAACRTELEATACRHPVGRQDALPASMTTHSA